MIHVSTKNKSFLKMHYILKQMGIENNTFFLQLYDETLENIDPLDEEFLNDEQKLRVHIEISKNPWYYFREIVKIPMTDLSLDFELQRATLAILWTLLNDLHGYVVIPRQCYKSYTVACFYSWLMYWGAKNFTGAFFAQNDGLVTQNLSRVKDIRNNLPKYLNLKSNADTDNQHSLVYRAGDFVNTLITRAPGMNEDSANNVGRGLSAMGIWFDEFAFIPFIWVQYGAAIPAYSTVSKAAERNGSRHHIMITTTAGNKKSKSGAWAYDFFNSCAPFTELLYDKVIYDYNGNIIGINKDEVKDYIINNNTGQAFLKIEYSWDELSKPESYLQEMRELMPGLDEFNRGVLNIWSDSNEDHPLGQERIEQLVKTKKEPIKIQIVDKIYVIKYYRDPELCKSHSKHIVFGMDCGGNTRRDYSTLVGVDVTNSEVVMTMMVNQYSINRFARAVAYVLMYLFPESTLVGERNYTGIPVLETISEYISRSRIYFEDPEDNKIGITMTHGLRNLIYGDILRISVVEHGHKIQDKVIIDQIAGLITDKNGRIDHKKNGGHDDLLIAYLYCRWFIMFCKTKRRYIDEIYFNSQLDSELTEEQLEEMGLESSEYKAYQYVMKDKGLRQMLENEEKKRDQNPNFVKLQLRNAIDSSLENNLPKVKIFGRDDDYISRFDNSPKINKEDIKLDTIAEEFLKDYNISPYEETRKNSKERFDHEKIEQETETYRDTSNDHKSMFQFSFMS